MTEGDALIYAYTLDGEGGGEVIDWPEIDNWDSSQDLLWMPLNSKMPDTRIWLNVESDYLNGTRRLTLNVNAFPMCLATQYAGRWDLLLILCS